MGLISHEHIFGRMVLPLDWMMHADIYILDELKRMGRPCSVKDMAIVTDYQRDYVSKRYKALRDAGLIVEPDDDELPSDVAPRGVGKITEKGRRYMDNELSDDELEELEAIGKSS